MMRDRHANTSLLLEANRAGFAALENFTGAW
jgi:hypothetical protein